MHSASVHHNINKYYQIESNYIFERTRMRFRNFSQSTSISCGEFSPAKHQAAAGGSLVVVEHTHVGPRNTDYLLFPPRFEELKKISPVRFVGLPLS